MAAEAADSKGPIPQAVWDVVLRNGLKKPMEASELKYCAYLNSVIEQVVKEHARDCGEQGVSNTWPVFDVKRYNRSDTGGATMKQYRSTVATHTVVTTRIAKLSGVFRCRGCRGRWMSSQCSIDLSGSWTAGVEPPRVTRLWHQQCKKCKTEEYPEFHVQDFDEQKADPKATPKRLKWLKERLERVLAIMAHEPVLPVDRIGGDTIDPNKHHLASHCELCKAGAYCTQAAAQAEAPASNSD